MAEAAEKPTKGQHGGKRDGAGRKPGVPNKVTKERQEKVATTGMTPHEVQIHVMRFWFNQYVIESSKAPGARKAADLEKYIDKAGAAANAAAPYVHPKLSAIALADMPRPDDAIDVTDYEDLDRLTDEEITQLYLQKVAAPRGRR